MTTERDEWADLCCPLPVLRFTWSDDPAAERGPVAVQHCGQPLHVEHTRTTYLVAGGEMEVAGPSWQVICEGGHVLLVPDDEGNDNIDELGFDVALVQEALVGIGVVASGGGPIVFKESSADHG